MCTVIIVQKSQPSRREIASLPSSRSVSQPALTYLTRQAQRREIKSKETFIALADVTGQGVTDKTVICSLYISLANCCYRCKSSLSFHQSQCVTHMHAETHVHTHTHIKKHTTNWPPALGSMYRSRVGKYGSVSRKVVISVMVSRCDTLSLAHWLLWSDSISASMTVNFSVIS